MVDEVVGHFETFGPHLPFSSPTRPALPCPALPPPSWSPAGPTSANAESQEPLAYECV